MIYYFIDDFNNICRQKDGMDKDFAEIIDLVDLIDDINKLAEEKEMWKRECERLKGLYYLENEKDEHLSWKRVDVE